MSYSSEQSNACQPTSVDPVLARKISYHLSKRDQCDLVALEYIAQNADPKVERGVTVLEMMRVMDLSNPTTSTRLRKMSDTEYGRIDTPLLKRSKRTGSQGGADFYFLADGVTLEEIQKIMAIERYSYESYHAQRQEKEKNKNNSGNEYEDELSDSLEDESKDVGSDQIDDQVDDQVSANEENQEESNSLEPDRIDEIDTEEVDSSDGDNENVEGIEVIIFRLLEEVVELKQNYTVIKEENVLVKEEIANLKEENVLVKEEIANLKIQLAKLEQKLSTGGSSRIVAMLDQVLAPNANQNGKTVR
ncbi:hypothetical protein [Kamptonema sp. UHCC 0994]|uniref:hypothetical protein n=1 Tax=Kamptonema sp. UHCC 0994 TaxID=3031329 RepID=UPI0023B9B531|nr:hypothetical protein [Kamptonema sp. UHCC 0994]MDF0555051.1 hypothetical protein [Kamptonema sp. UHCC 0994]